jgi:hypothetical protein
MALKTLAERPRTACGGRGGIRTHGGLPHARFRVECLKPDSATLPSIAAALSIGPSHGNSSRIPALLKNGGGALLGAKG